MIIITCNVKIEYTFLINPFLLPIDKKSLIFLFSYSTSNRFFNEDDVDDDDDDDDDDEYG